MKRNFIITIGFALTIGSLYAQQINSSKLDSLFQALESNNKYMGSIAVSHKGNIIYSKAIGYADMETKKKASPATIYRIGSISKMFTSALIFKAVEENKLTLDKTIDVYFPEIENAQKITISNLLYHRSGIFSFTEREDYKSWCTQPKTENEMIDIIAKGESQFEPDSKAKYSNSNYVLLTFVLEKTYNKPYKDILTEKILNPVGLKHTYLGGKINLKDDECYSYKYDGDWIKEMETDMSIPLGAGAVVSNPEDLTFFIESLFAGKIISEQSLNQMTTLRDNFGMGIFQVPFYDKKGFGHNGGIDGFSSFVGYFPQDTISIALTSNGSNFSNNDILIDVLSWYHNKPYNIPDFKTYNFGQGYLEQFPGIYSSEQIPLKITVSVKDNTLVAQATGQSSFGLEPAGENEFRFDAAGVIMRFVPDENKMILEQGGGVFTFTKE